MQAFAIGAGGIEHRGRFVRTRRFDAEQEAGRFLHNGAGTVFPGAEPGRNSDDYNVANINVQLLNGELLALWEAGSAYRVDPDSLATLGRKDWSAELRGVPFSAHPRFDEHGELWNIGSVPFSQQPQLALFHIGADGGLRKSRVVRLDFPGYMHDFILTPRYLVALNSSAVISSGRTFVDRFAWQAGQPSQLLVFDRNDFALLATIEVPATFVFHFGNGWERGDEIGFTACRYADDRVVTAAMRKLAMQECGPYPHQPELVRYSIDLVRRRATVEGFGIDLEFPSFDRRSPFLRQPLYGVGGQQSSPSSLASAVVRVDPVSGAEQRYDYGDGTVVEEPLYVPGSNGDYLVHTLLDYRRQRSGLAILRADSLADGPVAMALSERLLPLGFHGCFRPAQPVGAA